MADADVEVLPARVASVSVHHEGDVPGDGPRCEHAEQEMRHPPSSVTEQPSEEK